MTDQPPEDPNVPGWGAPAPPPPGWGAPPPPPPGYGAPPPPGYGTPPPGYGDYGSQPGYGAPPPGYPPGYGGPPGYPPYGSVGTNQKAIWALVCGIGGFCCCLIGIVAIVLGTSAKKEIAMTGEQGMGMAQAGFVLGIVSIVVNVLFVAASNAGNSNF